MYFGMLSVGHWSVSVSQTKQFFICYPQDVLAFTKLQAGSCIYMTINIMARLMFNSSALLVFHSIYHSKKYQSPQTKSRGPDLRAPAGVQLKIQGPQK